MSSFGWRFCTFTHVIMQLYFVAPNVHRSFENKIAPSLPFIGHRNKNDKNEDDRTERRVNECISKTI